MPRGDRPSTHVTGLDPSAIGFLCRQPRLRPNLVIHLRERRYLTVRFVLCIVNCEADMPTTTATTQRKAFGDALAGTVASLVALWAFYPIDVIKTRVQALSSSSAAAAAAAAASSSSSSSSTLGFLARHFNRNDNRNNTHRLQLSELLLGLEWKSIHTVCSSFCYFYVYSWIVSSWNNYRALSRGGKRQQPPKQMSVAARLLLASIAAIINTCATLPLDVVSARIQTKRQKQHGQDDEDEDNNKKADKQHWQNGEDAHVKNKDDEEEGQPQTTCECCVGSKKEEQEPRHRRAQQIQEKPKSVWGDIRQRLHYALGLWKGLGPSLLLCSNPAIHYTVFDTIKLHVLALRIPSSTTLSIIPTNQASLSTSEAFLLGWLAKFIATMVTYPLIRAKVMLMVTTSPEHKNMLTCLRDEYNRDGIKALYTGCNLQLLHTLFKSALLMTVRERITQMTHQLVHTTLSGQ